MKYQPYPAVSLDPAAFAADFARLSRAAKECGAPDYLPPDPGTAAALFLPDCPFPDPKAGEGRVKALILAVDPDRDPDLPDSQRIAGLAAGNASPDSGTAYVTVLLTDRQDGEGEAVRRNLLSALTSSLKTVNPGISRLRWVFYNPALLPWRLPEPFSSCSHPGAPGVMDSDPAMHTMLADGWHSFAPLTVYARPLADYAVPAPLLDRMKENASRGLCIELWDPALHGSFVPLVDALGSADWRRAILGNAEAENPLPMMIAADRSEKALRENGGRGFVCGFAGPMKRTADGRGYFAGIGIHPAYRSRGLGSTLFAGLCRGLRDLGADYMTLFTGTDGTAARIYEKAGFAPAARFSAMEKDLTETDKN